MFEQPVTPMSKAYDAVYELLFGDIEGEENFLAQLIKVGNRISFASPTERDPRKSGHNPDDSPEFQLVHEGGTWNPHFNSSCCQYIQQLSMYVQTGDWRYHNFAAAIDWAMITRWQKWNALITATKWCGQPFIKNLQTVPIQIGESNPMNPRKIEGWVVIWRANVEMLIHNRAQIYPEVDVT